MWIAHQQAVGIDSGQTERFTGSYPVQPVGPYKGGRAGYIIDVKLVYHTIQWNSTLQQFEYARLVVPLKVAAPDELEILRRDGRL